MMRQRSPKRGFTLIEVLIATSLFAIAAVIASSILVNVVQLEQKSSIQNAVYHDLRILLQQLSNEVQNGTVDYEEYYNMEVVQLKDDDQSDAKKFYGVNYGVYASRFYNPGRSLDGNQTINPADLGVECSFPRIANQPCEIYFTNSNDQNTGVNPYNSDGEEANAFCDERVGVNCAAKLNANRPEVNFVNELYLIDRSGTQKTIIGRKLMNGNDDYSIGMLRMHGRDLDQNGVMDVFSCEEEYKCFQADPGGQKIADEIKYRFIKEMAAPQDYLEDNGVSLPQKSDLQAAFIPDTSQFVPISPSTINVRDLTFIINPIENPYIAFGEKAVQMHPSVTILITVGLSAAAEEDYPGDFEPFTVQTTVAAGLVGKLDAYPPVNDVLRTNADKSWIDDVFTP